MDDQGLAREAAARAVVERLEAGMTIGLGSGRAVWRAIELIGERWPDGPPLKAAFASELTRELAAEVGIPAVELDGERAARAGDRRRRRDRPAARADQGRRRGAPAREDRGHGGRPVRRGRRDPQARRRGSARRSSCRSRSCASAGATRAGGCSTWCRARTCAWRATPRGSPTRVTTCSTARLPREGDLVALGDAIKATVGVVEHGLFLGLASEALLGTPDGGVEILTAP